MKEPVAKSPVPKKRVVKIIAKTMDFYEAIKKVVDGERIQRLEWEDKGFWGFLDEEILKLHKPTGTNQEWTISLGDLVGDDWIVL